MSTESNNTNNTNSEYIINISSETRNNTRNRNITINNIRNKTKYKEDLKNFLLIIVNTISFTASVVNPILGLIYGILMLVPARPFKELNTTWGITLIVLSLTGTNSIISFSLVYILMLIILSPVYIIICLVYNCRNQT